MDPKGCKPSAESGKMPDFHSRIGDPGYKRRTRKMWAG